VELKSTPKCGKEAITLSSEHNANDKLRVLTIGGSSVVREGLQSKMAKNKGNKSQSSTKVKAVKNSAYRERDCFDQD